MTTYAIATRGRPDTICRKTLAELRRVGVNDNAINVYAMPEEHDAYRAAFYQYGFDPNLWDGVAGMAAQRNRILDHTPPGMRVISCDDDMSRLLIRRSEKILEPIQPDEWTEIVAAGFDILDQSTVKAWGLYPVRNPFFMRPRVRLGECTYLGGCCFGYISTRDPDSPLRVTLSEKEDYERSVQCYLAGGVARFEWVTWEMKYRGEPGGLDLEHDRTDDRKDRETRELARRYPQLAHVKYRKNGEMELSLKDRR